MAVDSGLISANSASLSSVSGYDNVPLNIASGTGGQIVLNGLVWPSTDGTSGQILATAGDGTLTFVTPPAWVSQRTSFDTSGAIAAGTGTAAVLTTSPITLTLPSTTSHPIGKPILISKETSDTSAITIITSGTETISGSVDWTISTPYASVQMYHNGTDWFILA